MSTNWIYKVLATDRVPEWLVRAGIRKMLAQKIREQTFESSARQRKELLDFVEELKASPIAIHTDSANKQHYEVPARFFEAVLGPRLKYSSAFWLPETKSLEEAEINMLELYCERAELQDGQHILDLGCGWGSLSLFLAERYPSSQIVALSNSASQKDFIEKKARLLQLKNVSVIKADIAKFGTDTKFDRIISIEMFEHLKNYQEMFRRVSLWLNGEGKVFIHVFTHRLFAYHYEDKSGSDWLTSNFFEGGTMPSEDLFEHFQQNLRIAKQWSVPGTHYQKTAEAWLSNMKAKRQKVMEIMNETYGRDEALKWWAFWKIFFLSCAELWGYKNGTEWKVTHYLFEHHMR